MSESVSELKNLGPKSEQWLNEVGVFSKMDIERIGPVEIYRLLKERGFPASLNLVYALEAMLMDIHWTKLPEAVKAELKMAVKNI